MFFGYEFAHCASDYIFGLNLDVATRDKIIFGEYEEKKYIGGLRHFENLTLENLQKLVKENFACTEDKQNDCPTIGEVMEFMTKYPNYTAHGYVVSIKREAYRVSIEGVSKDGAAESAEELKDFKTLFSKADELVTGVQMYCWFD